MEGNQEQQLSSLSGGSTRNDNYDLIYEAWLKGEGNGSSLSLLFPELPNDYFKDKPEALTPIRWIPKSNISPYIARVDLNDYDEEFPREDIRPKDAWEIGVRFEF